ncbi:MAG: DUF6402 family protein [Pseudomonadota bacterium]
MSDSDSRLTYYKPAWLNLIWGVMSGEQGCTKLDVDDFYLSTAKPPPPLRDQPPPLLKPKVIPVRREMKSMIEVAIDFREWLNTPPLPKASSVTKSEPKPEPVKPKVKPFDIQGIPGAMEKLGWKYSANIMRKWFAGELNYSTNDKDDKNSVNQKGEPFPPSMVDTTTFTMDWILGYQRSKEKYEELISYDYLRSSNAKKTMVDILRRFPYLRYSRAERYPCNRYVIAPWEISKGDIRHYHANFQFQFIPVGKSWEEAFSRLIKNAGLSRLPFPDDLEGALANFNFYAAINRVEYQRTSQTTAKCLITEVSVYMRDTYSFYDRSGAGSQYLGHWNKTGIRVVPEMNVIGANNIHWLMDTITIDGTVSEGTVFYPVYNKDFRDWQEQYRQGGDMLLFSDRKVVKLTTPIEVPFEL